MNRAQQLVRKLLETDPDEIKPKDYLRKVPKATVKRLKKGYHVTAGGETEWVRSKTGVRRNLRYADLNPDDPEIEWLNAPTEEAPNT